MEQCQNVTSSCSSHHGILFLDKRQDYSLVSQTIALNCHTIPLCHLAITLKRLLSCQRDNVEMFSRNPWHDTLPQESCTDLTWHPSLLSPIENNVYGVNELLGIFHNLSIDLSQFLTKILTHLFIHSVNWSQCEVM